MLSTLIWEAGSIGLAALPVQASPAPSPSSPEPSCWPLNTVHHDLPSWPGYSLPLPSSFILPHLSDLTLLQEACPYSLPPQRHVPFASDTCDSYELMASGTIHFFFFEGSVSSGLCPQNLAHSRVLTLLSQNQQGQSAGCPRVQSWPAGQKQHSGQGPPGATTRSPDPSLLP